tara:strand:- start:544 stop:666 length:123 start_codon:yes stop_codon:yes gene_type:complete
MPAKGAVVSEREDERAVGGCNRELPELLAMGLSDRNRLAN